MEQTTEPRASDEPRKLGPVSAEATGPSGEGANMDEQAKYSAWIAELEGRREALWRNKKWVRRMLIAAAVTAPFGFFASPWAALEIAAFWISMAVISHYLIFIYRWDYSLQIQRAHDDAARLAEYRARPQEFDLPQDADDPERARFARYRIPRQAMMRAPWDRG